MRPVLKTNDPVLLSLAEALLSDAGIMVAIFDSHMSVMDGSLGILPRRLMVCDGDFELAAAILKASLPETSSAI